jgi:(1->4)-alpha-D-glucan 1-alpha-D-glucosylmutase
LPDRNTEYFLYQSMIGAWPIASDRMMQYMEKAAREAKQQTSWTQQNKEFEDALRSFIERLYESQEFMRAIDEFVHPIKEAGWMNGLAQTLLKCTAPGVPDTYQGSEVWDLHLVDPDNRGPIDYDARRAMLAELEAGMAVEEIVKQMDSGLPKLWTLYCALNLRRNRPEWFGADADFVPLVFEGKKMDHVLGYLRAESVATVVSRWSLNRGASWANTTVDLPGELWRNLLTDETLSGGRIPVQNILRRFPVALLVKEQSDA